MKKNQLFTGLFVAISLLFSSCDQGEITSVTEPEEDTFALTFNVSTPVGDKVVYTKADQNQSQIQDAAEYAINSLILYQYTCDNANGDNPKFKQVWTSVTTDEAVVKDKTFKLTANGDGSYSFSVRFAADYVDQYCIFKFVANDAATATPSTDTDLDVLDGYNASVTLTDAGDGEGITANQLFQNGFVMTGDATKVGDASNRPAIQLQKGVSCKVSMKRIVSRVDISYSSNNLLVTKVEARHVPSKSYLFEQSAPLATGNSFVTVGMNTEVILPDKILSEQGGKDKEEIKKVLYLYEHTNAAEDCTSIYIEYVIKLGELISKGSVEVPFKKDETTYIDTKRNTRYTIILGDGNSAGSELKNILWEVDEWTQNDMDEMVTGKDQPTV
ncbi:hypothetical protein [Parabacteroides sp.]